MKLVIVESPSKCKRIESYLGEGYKVIATCGHFRKIYKLEQIDFTTFKVKYENTNKRVIKRLQDETKLATEVILATDDDREGEMIAWHICQVCKLPLDTKRIIFREITKGEILKAIDLPKTINMNRVYSQNTRQILDIYIGFKISPLLWKYVKHTLSAGRCQTPALHLIAERERAIESQAYETNYKITGFFTNKDIEFHLERHLEKDDVIPFLESLYKHIFELSRNTKEVSEPPPPILNTCLLQQLPILSPQRIMRAAQTLYENGLITYLRTDSCNYSEDFLKEVSTYLGDKYCRPFMGQAQAHEGIRVTQLNIDIICLDDDANKLYSYLHKYTLQTCMKPAILLHKIYTTQCPNSLKFTYTAITPIFNGWKDFSKSPSDWSSYLDCLNTLNYNSISANEVFKSQTFHLSESQLIKELEKRNIGRPSTYTNIVESVEKHYVNHGKIIGNEYSLKQHKLIHTHSLLKDKIETSVIKKRLEESSKLSINEIGKEADAFCYKHFESIFNYDYTNQMELSLDLIESGEKEWKKVLREYIEHVNSLLSLLAFETVPGKVYTSLHAGYYKDSPVIIKDGVHGYYAEYKDKVVSLTQFSEKSEKIYSWIIDQAIPEESFKSLVDFILKDKVVMHITDSWSVRVGPHGNYLYFKAKNMKQPKFYPCPELLTRDEMEKHIRNKYKTI